MLFLHMMRWILYEFIQAKTPSNAALPYSNTISLDHFYSARLSAMVVSSFVQPLDLVLRIRATIRLYPVSIQRGL